MTISCIGRKFPSDSTLKNLTKDELIELLKIAEHNYQVQSETSKRQYDLLNIYFENMNFDSFQEMVSKVWCDEEQYSMHENDLQLPYDRCIQIDNEVDTLLEEEKKKQQLNKRKAKLIEDSKKSRHFAIYKWLGWNLMLEYVCGKILEAILVVPLFLLYCTDENVCEKVIHIVAPSMTDLIRIKMLKNKYMIPTNVIDCPISVKQLL